MRHKNVDFESRYVEYERIKEMNPNEKWQI